MKEKIVYGKDIFFNRNILEKNLATILILSHKQKKDRLRQRNSGLNEVLCKIAKNNNITLAIDLNEIKQEENKEEKAKILSRIIQNIKLIKKFKNKFKLINYKNKPQAKSFLLILGLPTQIIKQAV